MDKVEPTSPCDPVHLLHVPTEAQAPGHASTDCMSGWSTMSTDELGLGPSMPVSYATEQSSRFSVPVLPCIDVFDNTQPDLDFEDFMRQLAEQGLSDPSASAAAHCHGPCGDALPRTSVAGLYLQHQCGPYLVHMPGLEQTSHAGSLNEPRAQCGGVPVPHGWYGRSASQDFHFSNLATVSSGCSHTDEICLLAPSL